MTKFLNISTDTTLGGSSASDEVVSSQKALKTYIDNHSGGGSVAIDEKSITKNSSDELQTVGVIDQRNTANAIKTWTGTKAQYDSISTKDANTIYNITDDTTALSYEAYTKAETNALLSEKVNLASGVSQANVDYVIESQLPTSSNDYTWYRLYKSGWVEQGGRVSSYPKGSANNASNYTVSLPIEMADTNYYIAPVTFVTDGGNTTGLRNYKNTPSTTTLEIGMWSTTAVSSDYMVCWEVKGMSA